MRILGLVIALALAATLLAMACAPAAQPETPATPDAAHEMDGDDALQTDNAVINMAIANQTTDLTRDDLKVKKGDTVNINFTSDEPGEIHLHGYNLTAAVAPDNPGSLTFVAETAGAFALNFHVFAGDATSGGNGHGNDDHHNGAPPASVVSETPMSVNITAAADDKGGVNVQISTEGFRFAPDLVDQAHTPGAGHAHIYLDGIKLGRVFATDYYIEPNLLTPGQREIRVSLNTNDHSQLLYAGKKLEATTMLTVPDTGQKHSRAGGGHASNDHTHPHPAEQGPEIIAEVHLGNLEVHP